MKIPHISLSWINSKRIQVYPRLFLVTIWLILGMNFTMRDGWQGGLGQIIGGDFIMFYSTGLLYKEDPSSVYDYSQQFQLQQDLVSPTPLLGVNPYMNPPYVAPVYSLLSYSPLVSAFLLWTSFMIVFVIAGVVLLMKIIPEEIKKLGLTFTQFLILVFSFLPLIESLQAGQNSGLTFLLVTCVVFSMIKSQDFIAGVFTGLMLYKPQYVLGFLILWLVWKNYKSLLGFAMIALSWAGTFLFFNSIDLYQTYLEISKYFLYLPYLEGFPESNLVTLYGFLTTIFPQTFQRYLYTFSQVVLLVSLLVLGFLGYKLRKVTIIRRTPAIALAIIMPLVATPYAQLHDLIILIPGFVLWSRFNPQRGLLLTAAVLYIGSFLLTFLGLLTHIALNALLVIGIVILILYWSFKGNTVNYHNEQENDTSLVGTV